MSIKTIAAAGALVLAACLIGASLAPASAPAAARDRAEHVVTSQRAQTTISNPTDPAVWAFEAPMAGVPNIGARGELTAVGPFPTRDADERDGFEGDYMRSPLAPYGSSLNVAHCLRADWAWPVAIVPDTETTSAAHPEGFWAASGHLPRTNGVNGYAAIAALSTTSVDVRALCPDLSLQSAYVAGADAADLTKIQDGFLPDGSRTPVTLSSSGTTVTISGAARAQTTFTVWALNSAGSQLPLALTITIPN